MAKERILVVDDEEDIQNLIRYNLETNGFTVECVSTGEQALEKAHAWMPDLILLDLMLPGIDGLDTCRILKNDTRTAHLPVIMITAKGAEADIVTGLELGADDYMTKPFSPRVLLARVKAIFRRGRDVDQGTVFTKHSIELNITTHEVRVEGSKTDLTASEFNILHLLLRRPGWVFTRNQIINAIKGDDYPVTDRSIDVQIVGLRKKLGSAGVLIETVRGVGYRIKD